MPSWWPLIRAAKTLGMSYVELADHPAAVYLVGVAATYEELTAEFREKAERAAYR